MQERETVVEAIRASWSIETSAHRDEWTVDNPAKGQCDVSSFVAWEYLGGELVLSQVFIDGALSEYHYSNRIAGEDLDLTREQFAGGEEIDELIAMTSVEITENRDSIKPDVAARIDLFRTAVESRIGPSQ